MGKALHLAVACSCLAGLVSASRAAGGSLKTATVVPGRWRGVHTANGIAHRQILLVKKSDRDYSARGLIWFGVTEEQARAASRGQAPRNVRTPGARIVLQVYDVLLKNRTLTLRGTRAKFLYGKRSEYRPDSFAGELKPPGVVTGEATDAGGNKATFQFWKETALDKPRPLDLTKGKTHQLACLDTDAYHYSCYIPERYDPATPAPVLMNCSPGGRGKPLSTKMADELGWIMVGLTESRNGPIQPSCENRDAVLFDLRRRFHVHPRRLYLSGFSGGARMAAWSGIAYPEWCAGIICIGAGYLQVPPPLHQPVFFIVGKTDMNHREVTTLYPAERKKGRKTRLLIHPGGHNWGRPHDHEEAIRWLDSLHKADAKHDRKEKRRPPKTRNNAKGKTD